MSEFEIAAADGGRFAAYYAEPAVSRAPGLVLIQEIFGVNQVMRDLADRYAAQGYHVLCPDLFWRQAPGVSLTDKTEAEWNQAYQLMGGFNEAQGVADLIATLENLRRLPGATGKAGTVGYCLGGRLSYLMATRSNSDANVGYYGVNIDQNLGEASAITKPLMLQFATEDKYSTAAKLQQITEGLGQNALITLHIYEGLQHAFARPGGPHYDAAAANLADARTAEFLHQYLK